MPGLGYVRKSARKKKPPSRGGHPSRGGKTVGGGTKSPPTVYRSPTPDRVSPGGHPSRGGTTVGGGTKSKPRAYRSPTPKVQKRERAERRQAARTYRKLRGSKAAKSSLSYEDRLNIDIAAELDRLKKSRTRIQTSGPDLRGLATPAIRALDETTRLAEASAAGFESQLRMLQGKDELDPFAPAKAAYKSGVTREKRRRYSDVLRTAGAEDALKGVVSDKVAETLTDVVGTGLDIGLDPVTYATLGVGGGARAATRTAEKVFAKELKKGIKSGSTKTQAKKRAKAAAHRAYKNAPKNRGVTVGLGRKQTSGKTSAKVSRALGVPAAARMVTRTPAAEAIRRNLPIRPADITEKEWHKLKAADRERRGTMMHGTRRVARKARAIRKATGGTFRRLLPERDVAGGNLRVLPRRRHPASVEASAKVRDAIERLDLSGLTPKERMGAEAVMEEQEHLFQLQVQAGGNPTRWAPSSADEPQGYVARQAMRDIDDRKTRKAIKRTGQPLRDPVESGSFHQSPRRTTTMKDYRRGDRRPMAEVRGEEPSRFVEDLETTLRAKAQKDIGRASNTRYRGRVMATGRQLDEKAKLDPKTEGVFTVKEGRLVEVSDKQFVPGEAEDFVILKKSVAEHANETMRAVGRLPFWDAATSKVKWLLTVPNPQYWARNTYGGMFNAWETGVPAHSLVGNLSTVARANRRITKRQRAEEQLGKQIKDARPVAVLPGGKKMPMDEFLDELERVNVSGGGQTQELLGAEFARRHKAQAFEDAPRLAAYIHFRRAGKQPEEAARLTLKSQFDYGDLSSVEHNWARRIFPFYTWRSRNTVLQAKTLVQRPGKLATTEKVRDTLAEMAGLPEDWQEQLSEAERLGVPFPLPFELEVPGLGKQTIMLFPALPVADLNIFTTSFPAFFQQIASSAHPVPKAGVEFLTNYSIFFRDNIEQTGSRWTAAPDVLIERLPVGAREYLRREGIIRWGKDRWTDKWTWQWRGKTSYLFKLTPESATASMVATSGANRVGQTRGLSAFGWLTGVRPKPFVPDLNRLYKLYDQRDELETRMADMEELRTHKKKGWSREHSGEQGWNKPHYDHLQDQKDKLDRRIFRLEDGLGKKDVTKPTSMGGSDDDENPYVGKGKPRGGRRVPAGGYKAKWE